MGFKFRQGTINSNLFEESTVALGPSKFSVEWVLGFFPTDKTAEA